MSKIDDALIKKLVLEYQETGEGFSEIVGILSEYIYIYPRVHSKDKDACGEFYLYFFSKFKSALQKYKLQKCQFLTWLTVVLYRQYLNWLKSKKKTSNHTVYLDAVLASKENSIGYHTDSSAEVRLGIISKVLASLPNKLRIVMKLHYFDFFTGKDLKEAAKIFKQDELLLLSKYSGIADNIVKQYEHKNKLIDKLSSIYYDITTNKAKLLAIDEETYPDYALKKQIENKIAKSQEQQKKRIAEYEKFYVTVKNDIISDFLGISLNAVHNLVYRGKKLIKKELEDK